MKLYQHLSHQICPVLDNHIGFHLHTSGYAFFSFDDGTNTDVDAFLYYTAMVNDSTAVDDAASVNNGIGVDDCLR